MSTEKQSNAVDDTGSARTADPDKKDEVERIEKVESSGASVDSNGISEAARERKLLWRLDLRVLPIICMVYLFNFLDRTNIGNARLQGLPQDALHGDPTGVLFDWVNSAYFFSYILCQVPVVISSKLFPPRLWLGGCAIGWGICSTLMSTGFDFPGLIVTRVAIGVFESGFAPCIPLYMSYFYTKEEIGLRLAYFFGFAAVAGAFGGLIAFGIQNVHAHIANWRLLFIVDGIPSVLMGIVAIMFLPDRPEYTKFFDEKERKLALARGSRGISADIGYVVKKSHIFLAAREWRVYVAGVLYFGANCSLASLSAFLPTIIKTFASTNATAQLLTVPPYAVAAVVLVMCGYASDRMQNRGIFMVSSGALSGIGYLLLLVVPSNIHVRYFATFCIVSGTYTTIGIILSWYAHNLGSESKRAAGIPMFMSIGQCGSILGSHIFLATEGPRYIKGYAICCGLMFLAAFCSFVISISYRLENHRRDRVYGRVFPGTKVDTTVLADKTPEFRYVP